ncbi:MAG: hypothetical protein HON65_09540 [Rhodospirillales bacterium]|jgi:hypothetical protein|nr:hypothetical protein [Rhodospirillales bacterium]
MKNFSHVVIVAFLGFALASCASVKTQQSAPPPSVSVNLPNGPPAPMALALARSVVLELKRWGYASHLAGEGAADFVLRGKAEELDASQAPRVATISWVLLDQTQEEVGFLHQSVNGSPDAWAYGSPAMIRIIGEETAANLSPFLGELPNVQAQQEAQPEQQDDKVVLSLDTVNDKESQTEPDVTPLPSPPNPPAPVSSGNTGERQFGLWIDMVTGAPGNGNEALTVALIDMLEALELPFAKTPGMASHYIQGVVDVAVRDATTEHVTIVWVVRDPAGDEIGRVTQRNDITRGVLHQAWQDTAKYAAQGGVEGIAAILERDLSEDL